MAKKDENQEPKPTQDVPEVSTAELLQQIQALQEDRKKDQETMKMLYEIADKGRVFNYEAGRAEKKPSRVKLSLWRDGVIVGWRTVKDELVKHPTTGRTVGESQEYEVLVQSKDGKTSPHLINGYPAFSEARYGERVEAEVVGKKEDYKGNLTFDVEVPEFGKISLDTRFVN